MYEMQHTAKPGPVHSSAAPGTASPADSSILTSQEQVYLRTVRARYEDGALTEWPDDYRRLRFVRWLYRQGALTA